MKFDVKIILIALLFGVLFWFIDAYLDFLFFYKENFWGLFITDPPSHEIYIRITILAFFGIFGLIVSNIVQRLKVARENLQVTIQSIGDAFIATDILGRVSQMNPIAENLTGWTQDEAKGQPITRIFNIINSKTREGVENLIHKVLRQGGIVGLANHTSLISKQGVERQIADSGSPIRDHDGRLLGVVLVFRDVTEIYNMQESIRNNEIFLNAVLHSIQDGISVLNPDLTIRYTNGIMTKWYADQTPLEGKYCYQCYHYISQPCENCPTLRCMVTKKTESEIIRGPKGSEIEWIELFSYPVINPITNTVDAIVEFKRDITLQYHDKQKIEQLNRMLKGIRNVNQLIVVEKDRQRLLQKTCNEFVSTQGYTAAVIVLMNKGKISLQARSNSNVNISQLEPNNCINKALSEPGIHIINKNDDACNASLLDPANPDGYIMYTQLNYASDVFGVIAVSCDPDTILDEEAQDLFLEVAGDIALALYNMNLAEEKEKAVQALAVSEEKNKRIIESSPFGIHMYKLEEDDQLIFTGYNTTANNILHFDHNSILGKTIKEAFPSLAATEIPEKYRLAAREGISWSNEQIEYKDDKIAGAFQIYAFQTQENQMAVFFFDITERKLAEDALKESEERYRQLAETAYDIICIHDMEGNVKYLNQAGKKMLGIQNNSLPTLNIKEFVDPGQSDSIQRRQKKRQDGDTSRFLYESVFINAKGERLMMEVSSTPIMVMGEINDILIVARDNTEKYRALHALEESEANYRLLVENQTDLVVKLDAESRFLFVSQSYCETFGKSEKELLGNTFMPLVHEDDLESTMKSLETLYSPPHTCYHEQRAMTRNGWRWFGWSDKAIIDENNQVVEIIGVGRDITERVGAEQELSKINTQLDALLRSSPSAIVNVNTDGIVQYWNPAAEAMFGWTKEEVIGKFSPLVNADDAKDFINRLHNDTESLNTVEELPIIRKDGTVIQVRMASGLIYDNNRNIISMTGVFTDITERKRTDRILKNSLAEKEILLKEIHHRVKNNMAIIMGLLNLQSNAMRNNPEIAGAFQESINRIRSMALVHEKLYKTEDFANINFGEYIQSMADELLQIYDIHKKVKIIYKFSEINLDINKAIPCGLILNELVTNSLKHAFVGRKAGHLWISLVQTGDNVYKLSVTDDGIGVDKGKIENSKTLGMQLISNLTSQIQGTLDSNYDKGASFEITFPGNE